MVESQRVRNLLVFTLWDSPPSYFLTDFPSNCICSFMVWVRCPGGSRGSRHTFNPTIGTNLGRGEKSVRRVQTRNLTAASCLPPQTSRWGEGGNKKLNSAVRLAKPRFAVISFLMAFPRMMGEEKEMPSNSKLMTS